MDDQNTPDPTGGAEAGSPAGGPQGTGTPSAHPGGAEAPGTPPAQPAGPETAATPQAQTGGPGGEGAPGERGAEAGGAVATEEAAPVGSAPDFEQLQEPGAPGQTAPLAMLYDLDLPVAIELGRTRMAVQDVLALARGSVVQLDRQAGEPVDVYVGDKRFAEAEVVIVGEQFGVRITRLVSNAALSHAG